MKVYRRQLTNYNNIISDYNEKVEAYNTKVAYAREEATNRWKAAQAEAEKEVRKQWAGTVSRNATNIGSAITTGAALGVAIGNAKSRIQFQPYFNQVLGERDLTVAPKVPNVSKPIQPTEPKIETTWKKFTYQQPCPFEALEFDKISGSNSFAIAKQNGKFGVVNSLLETAIPFEYDNISEQNDYYIVVKNGNYGVSRRNGQVVFPCQYKDAKISKENDKLVLLNRTDDGWGAIDMNNKEIIIKNQYEEIKLDQLDTKDICFNIKNGGKWGICQDNGKIIVNTEYDSVDNYYLVGTNYFFIQVKKDGLCSLFTTKGEKLASDFAKWAWSSEPFLQYYTNDHKTGIVGIDVPEVIPSVYDKIDWEKELHAFIVTKGNEIGVYSIDGQTIIKPFKCNNISYTLGDEYFVFQSSENVSKYGACDFQGNIIVEPKYKYESIGEKARKALTKMPNIHNTYIKSVETLNNLYTSEKQKLKVIN